MANRRMISKSISTSKRLARVSDGAALLFTWLIPHCDDGGNFDADPMVVKGAVMPMRMTTIEDAEKLLSELVEANLITYYKGKEDEKFLHIVQWENHQTLRSDRVDVRFPTYGKPTVPQAATAGAPNVTEHNVTEHNRRERVQIRPKPDVALSPGSGGNKKMGDAFDRFWSAYPRKVHRQEAQMYFDRFWVKIQPEMEKMVTFIEAAKKTHSWREPQYVPLPEKFLEAERWKHDDLASYGTEKKRIHLKLGQSKP